VSDDAPSQYVDDRSASSAAAPLATVERAPRRLSWVWLVPVLALALLGTYLGVQVSKERGPAITITFQDAAGIESGAAIIHRGLTVGVVRTVELTESLDSVVVRADLAPHAAGLAREGAKFWVVKPEVSLAKVQGLETLLGPRYIAMQPAEAGAPPARGFVGDEGPPPRDPDGSLEIVLMARSAGDILPGTPVLYRGMPVGVVRHKELSEDSTRVRVTASIDPAHSALVRENTRFWNASGVGVDFGLFRGLTLNAGTLDSMLQGALQFATPNRPGEPVQAGHEFELAPEPDSSWLDWSPEITLVPTD
jgi:paraquat-inducible protein B